VANDQCSHTRRYCCRYYSLHIEGLTIHSLSGSARRLILDGLTWKVFSNLEVDHPPKARTVSNFASCRDHQITMVFHWNKAPVGCRGTSEDPQSHFLIRLVWVPGGCLIYHTYFALQGTRGTGLQRFSFETTTPPCQWSRPIIQADVSFSPVGRNVPCCTVDGICGGRGGVWEWA
jgi:hypothetical protein